MLRHKHIDRLCCAVLAVTLLLTCLYMGAAASGLILQDRIMGYESKLFDQSRVHTIDIRMDDWDAFLQTATQEEYAPCDLIIDGERYANAAIRGKGNTSLSSVQQYGNNRYSFKVEFDHYQSASSYYGLDKLSLNNVIQDNTYMKDYLAYTLMGRMGVAAPLCSFVSITVNGERWGLYLAVEGVEDSFLQRNYGKNHGELYKPDSMSFGGGRGNGRDFDMNSFMEDFDFSRPPDMTNPFPAGKGGMDRGVFSREMGSADVKLQYVDDRIASYANIFDNAKTDITKADQQRLIASLKSLSEGNVSVVNTDAVIRYLAVHNFLCNDDSYTGQMVHNYYLYEENGVLSMIPWDYNLAFGGFQSSGATDTVNSPIDSPVSQGDISDRPMVAWIFGSAETQQAYHAAYQTFIDETISSGWFAEEFDRVSGMITPYVESDPTAFCTYDAFLQGVQTLRSFCLKRAESVLGQLAGSIPSTTEGQRNTSALVDASDLDLSAMGSMGHGGPDDNGLGRGSFGGGRGGMRGFGAQQPGSGDTAMPPNGFGGAQTPGFGGQQPGSGDTAVPPDGFGGTQTPGFGAQQPGSGDTAVPPGGFGGAQTPGGEAPGLTAQQTPAPVPGEQVSLPGIQLWLILALCAAGLLAALLIAGKYKTFR